jgi:hypothetical protein
MPHIYKIHAMADGSRSSSAGGMPTNAAPAPLRWLMPSVTDLLFVAILATLVFTPLSVKLLNDAGTGWHIRTGQLIVATRQVPRVDPFSSQIHKTWFAWEWLYDIVIGRLETWCGLNGAVWFTAIVIATVFAWTFRLLIVSGTHLLNALVLTLLATGASMIHFLARPHVLSWLFVIVWFRILESTESENNNWNQRRKLWLLPFLMLIWVNVHGGFLLGFVLLAIYWLGSLWSWWNLNPSRMEESFQKIVAGKRSRDLTFVGLASLAASLVNPYGWKLHQHILGYLSNRFLMNHIEEFQSPNFHNIAPQCFLIILLITLAVVAARGRQLKLSQILLMLFAAYAGIYSARNIPTSSILLVLIIGPLLPSFSATQFFQRMLTVDSQQRSHLWPIAATLATFLLAVTSSHAGSQHLMDAHFSPNRMPVTAVNYIESNNVQGPILSPDYWGGYLIYRLYPYNKVVVDDRHDFYGEPFLKSYLTMIHVEPGWEQFLKWRAACIVLPNNSALAAVLTRTPEWKSVYSDDLAIIFIPTQEPEDTDRALKP